MKIEGVDSLTSASKMDEMHGHVGLIQKSLNALLSPE
jgi:hypothetical protein